MCRLLAGLGVILVIVTGCGSSGTPQDAEGLFVDESISEGSYRISIQSTPGSAESYSRRLVGETINSNWAPSISTIYLGTDAVNQPLGTVTMGIGDIVESDGQPGVYVVRVDTAFVSASDSATGPTDARTFQLVAGSVGAGAGGSIQEVELGRNFIRGELVLLMQQILPPPDEPIIVKVSGEFVATDGS